MSGDQAPKYPWYWNDEVNPWDGRWAGKLADVLGLHRARDENPDDMQLPRMLSDAHAELGDDLGASFWQMVAATDRRPDFYNGLWWFDNTIIYPTESRFAIMAPAVWLMERGEVLIPTPITENGAEVLDPAIGFKTRPSVKEQDKEAIITEFGFDGRLLAETTLLQCWRKMTDAERARAMDWDFDFLDPAREPKAE